MPPKKGLPKAPGPAPSGCCSPLAGAPSSTAAVAVSATATPGQEERLESRSYKEPLLLLFPFLESFFIFLLLIKVSRDTHNTLLFHIQ